MDVELTKECDNCKTARKLLEKINNAAGSCYFLGYLHAVAGDQSRGSKSPFNGPLDLVCHDCGTKGRVLSVQGLELVGLVREHLDRQTGEMPSEEETIAAVELVAEGRGERSAPAKPATP